MTEWLIRTTDFKIIAWFVKPKRVWKLLILLTTKDAKLRAQANSLINWYGRREDP